MQIKSYVSKWIFCAPAWVGQVKSLGQLNFLKQLPDGQGLLKTKGEPCIDRLCVYNNLEIARI